MQRTILLFNVETVAKDCSLHFLRLCIRINILRLSIDIKIIFISIEVDYLGLNRGHINHIKWLTD